MPEPHGRVALALVRDLIFASKISATARAVGVTCRVLRDPEHLAPAAGDLLLVDLNDPGAIDAAAGWGERHGRPVVGFVSHVDTERIARARAAGISRIMARSGFVESLADLLTTLESPS